MMVKAQVSEKTSLRKGHWTPEEDWKLVAYIRRYGIWNWNEMPKYAGLLRCGKSCRLRWVNYLRPNVKLGNFSQEEDEVIILLHKQLGNRWSAIASRLPGRTDNEIKNHWNARLKKRLVMNNQHQVKVPSITNSLQETQTAKQQMQNPPELLLLTHPLPASNAPVPSKFDVCINCSSSISCGSVDEIYKIQGSELNNYGTSSQSFQELQNFWEQPFITEGLCMTDDYDAPYTYTDPGFRVSTSLLGFEEDYIFQSASNHDADDDFSDFFVMQGN